MTTSTAVDDAGDRLPSLRPDLRLFRGAPDDDGSPMWMLFDPVRSRYFHLHLRGLRLLGKWRAGATPDEVAKDTSRSGTPVDREDVEGMAQFLLANGLTVARTRTDTARLQDQHARSQTRWWQWVLHRYLFFRIPLIRPDPFVSRTLRFVRPVASWSVCAIVVVLGTLGIFLAIRQWEEFAGTFVRFLDWDGVIWYAGALIFVKAVHEFAHAYTAKSRGCRVPTMGIAFLVLFPFLYTDATDTWKLTRRKDRLSVTLAGVVSELAIALIATFAWGVLADGPVRQAAFFLATTSWVTSLLINLSPFMRFDGYHALSDLWGIDNLQPRAFDVARWRLREALFGFGDPPPETFRADRRRALVAYAIATWIYRLFLFIGIALLVYHFAFKALGIFLFVVEIGWFIGRPIIQECAVITRRTWKWNRRTIRTALVLVGLVAVLFIPWRTTLPLPAVFDSMEQARVYASEPARVASVNVEAGDRVSKDDVLLRLEKPRLAMKAKKASYRIAALQARLSRRAGSVDDLAASYVLRQRLTEQQTTLDGLRQRQKELTVRSPVQGVIARRADLRSGQWVSPEQLLVEIVSRNSAEVVAYVHGGNWRRVKVGNSGRFIPDDGAHSSVDLEVMSVENVGSETLPYKILSSEYGGSLPVVKTQGSDRAKLEEGTYRVRLSAVNEVPPPQWRVRGRASIEAPPESIAGRFIRYAAAVLIRESGF